MSSVFVVIASIVTASATIVLAFVGCSSLCLARSIKERSEQHERTMEEQSGKHEQEIRDLLQALVLAQMLSPHGGQSTTSAIGRFKGAYKGKTAISF